MSNGNNSFTLDPIRGIQQTSMRTKRQFKTRARKQVAQVKASRRRRRKHRIGNVGRVSARKKRAHARRAARRK